MKTYIVNLERSEKRREHIVSEMNRVGLDFEIVKAIDGSLLTPAELEELCDMAAVRKYPQWLIPGAIGAALSHRTIYGRMIENNDLFALIAEDDAVLPNDLPETLKGIGSALRGREVALLYYSSFEPLQLSSQNSSRLSDESRLMYPMFLKGVGGAVCYVITQSAARSMYDRLLPIAAAADSWVDFIGSGYLDSIRCVYPMTVDHLGVKSTISATAQGFFRRQVTEMIDKYEVPVLNKFLTGLRQNSLSVRTNFAVTESRSPLDSTRSESVEPVHTT